MSDLLYTGGDFMQILIIEDEKRLADALGQIMQEARYQADIVYDGRDGLAYASSCFLLFCFGFYLMISRCV